MIYKIIIGFLTINIFYYRLICKINVFVITQFIAHKKSLPQMFDAPMKWCLDNIDVFSTYFNKENQV